MKIVKMLCYSAAASAKMGKYKKLCKREEYN
jgi:hypothetical protein